MYMQVFSLHRYVAKHTELTIWNRTAITTVVLKPVCVIWSLRNSLSWAAKNLFARSLAFLDCTCHHFCYPLFSPSLHSSTVGSWCVLKHVSSQITVRNDRPLASHSHARLIFGRDYDIMGQNAWFPHWNCPPFQFTFTSSHCIDSSCSHSTFEWNPGFPVFFLLDWWWPYACPTRAIKVTWFEFIFSRYFINQL